MKKVLGKGLSALIPSSYAKELNKTEINQNPSASGGGGQKTEVTGLTMMPLTQISPNSDQPRKNFTPEALEELAESIREKGVMQPVIVKQDKDGKYKIICGERRFRAAGLCGLDAIPVVVKDIAEKELLEWALIENIQREDLNPIEEAEAYQKISEQNQLSQEELAKRVGKDRSTVTNSMRLLRLPQEIREMLSEGLLAAGHARALLALITPEHQRQLAKRISQDNLSVRQVEAIVGRSNAQKRKPKKARHLKPEIIDLENRMVEHFGTQVKIFPRKNHKEGKIEIHYFSLDDLDRILEKAGLPENR